MRSFLPWPDSTIQSRIDRCTCPNVFHWLSNSLWQTCIHLQHPTYVLRTADAWYFCPFELQTTTKIWIKREHTINKWMDLCLEWKKNWIHAKRVFRVLAQYLSDNVGSYNFTVGRVCCVTPCGWLHRSATATGKWIMCTNYGLLPSLSANY